LEYFEEDTDGDRAFYIVQQEARGRSLAAMLQGGMRADDQEVRRAALEGRLAERQEGKLGGWPLGLG
jgi:hypothetical protein